MHRASNILPFHLFLVRESLSPGATPAPYLRHIFQRRALGLSRVQDPSNRPSFLRDASLRSSDLA